MNNILKLGVNLFTICAVAALLLGVTSKITAPVIEERSIQINNESRQIVLPEVTEFTKVDTNDYENIDDIISEVYEGKNGLDIVGYAIKTLPKGYGGQIEVIVGISLDGKVTGINIGEMSETPGLGAKANESEFKSQFKDKSASKLSLVKGKISSENEVSAISGATITSSAVTNGVNSAIEVFNSYLNK